MGAVLGRVVHQVRLRLRDPRLESALGLVVPFAAYALAEQMHVSGVLAVVVTGLFLGHHGAQAGYATRLQDQAVWQAADTVLEAFVFALIGLQLPAVVRGVGDVGLLSGDLPAASAVAPGQGPGPGAAVAGSGDGLLGRDARGGHPRRGVLDSAGHHHHHHRRRVPRRPEIIFVAFFVTVGTLLLHGLTLPWVIRRLGVQGRESHGDALAEADAIHAATQAALARLESASDGAPESVTTGLRRAADTAAIASGSGSGVRRPSSARPPASSTAGCAWRC